MYRTQLTQETQLEHLKAHYGLSLNFVEVTVPLTENEMVDIWGECCDEYEHGCSLCRVWHQWQTNNYKVTLVVSRDAIVKAVKED